MRKLFKELFCVDNAGEKKKKGGFNYDKFMVAQALDKHLFKPEDLSEKTGKFFLNRKRTRDTLDGGDFI